MNKQNFLMMMYALNVSKPAGTAHPRPRAPVELTAVCICAASTQYRTSYYMYMDRNVHVYYQGRSSKGTQLQ